MMSTARVRLPAPVEVKLKRASEFVDNITEFAREDLIGFRRPLAAAFAFTAPLVLAIVYKSAGLAALAQVAAAYIAVAAGGLYLVGRSLWPGLVKEYETRAAAKRRALADLKCGFGEAAFLNLPKAARFFEYEHGVLALADAGDFKTIFFSIAAEESDPRWVSYATGEMNRRIWRWLRLPVSHEIVRFSSEGSKHAQPEQAPFIASIDVWEAVHCALGEPVDGAVIHQPFGEVVETVERLL
jgi:hypothetical protein